MFQGLRQGALLYILDKRKQELQIAQVVSVSNPMPRYQAATQPNMLGGIEQVVDVSVMTTSGQTDYKQLPAMLSVANFQNDGVVLTDNREAMTNEIESMCRASQSVLASVPYHQSVVSKRDDMLMQLNPELAKSKQQEAEIANLNAKIASMEGMMSRMEALLSKSEKQTKTKSYGNDNTDN